MTTTAPTGVDPSPPVDVLVSALDLMLAEQQFETIVFFVAHHPVLLSRLRELDVSSPFIDYDGLRQAFPQLHRHLLARRARARALDSLDGRSMEQQIQQLEERLADIRREVGAHAIGSPIAR